MALLRASANLYSVLQLKAHCHAKRLVISEHCGGYDRRGQHSAQIPREASHNFNVKVKRLRFGDPVRKIVVLISVLSLLKIY